MTNLSFSISGDFITNLARQWFWQENKPFHEVYQLLDQTLCTGDMLSTMEKHRIITDILEYRSDLHGIDSFTLIDHLPKEDYKSIFTRIQTLEKELMIERIKNDMQYSFQKYVDQWSAIISLHPDVVRQRNPQTYHDWELYLTTEHTMSIDSTEPIYIHQVPLIETPTMGGLWLINDPELVYECMESKEDLKDIGSPQFWKNIYEHIKDAEWAKDRNERYLFSTRPKPSVEERMEALCKAYETENKKEPRYMTPEWFAYKLKLEKSVQYLLEPDNMQNWEGLIAPNGDFYSVNFGGHNQKAYFLLHKNPKAFGFTKDSLEQSSIDMSNALDTLIEHGWCATRSVMMNSYLLCNRPTKAQINAIFDAIQKFEVNLNTEELFSYLE